MSQLLQKPEVNSEVREIIQATGTLQAYSYDNALATFLRVFPSNTATAEEEMWPTILAILDVAFGLNLGADTSVYTDINPMQSRYRVAIKVHSKGNPRELHIVGHGEYGNNLYIKIDPDINDVSICRINAKNAAPIETFWTELDRLLKVPTNQLDADKVAYRHQVQFPPLAISIIFKGLSSSLHPSATAQQMNRLLCTTWPTRGKHKDGPSKVLSMLYSQAARDCDFRCNPGPLYKQLAHLAVNCTVSKRHPAVRHPTSSTGIWAALNHFKRPNPPFADKAAEGPNSRRI